MSTAHLLGRSPDMLEDHGCFSPHFYLIAVYDTQLDFVGVASTGCCGMERLYLTTEQSRHERLRFCTEYSVHLGKTAVALLCILLFVLIAEHPTRRCFQRGSVGLGTRRNPNPLY